MARRSVIKRIIVQLLGLGAFSYAINYGHGWPQYAAIAFYMAVIFGNLFLTIFESHRRKTAVSSWIDYYGWFQSTGLPSDYYTNHQLISLFSSGKAPLEAREAVFASQPDQGWPQGL